MLQRVTDVLYESLGLEFVAIVRIESEHQRFVCEAVTTRLPTGIFVGYSRALGSGVVGRAAILGEYQLVHDAATYEGFVDTLPGAQSELAVPIQLGRHTLAVLNVESTQTGQFDDKVELLQAIAAQLAGPIAAIERLQQLDERNRWLETIGQTMRSALEAPDVYAICDRILAALAERLPVIEGTLLLLGDLKEHLQVMAHRGASPHITYRNKQWSVELGVVGRAFRTGVEQWLPAVQLDPDYTRVNPRVVCELAVPIRFRKQTLGVLNLESAEVESFGGMERLAIRTLCDQAAGAIHLALTNQQLELALLRLKSRDAALESTRESLTRAVKKLSRKNNTPWPDGELARIELLNSLRRESRALRRGARVAGLWLIQWSLEPSAEAQAQLNRTLETELPHLAGKLHRLDATKYGMVFGAAARLRVEQSFARLTQWAQLQDPAARFACILQEQPVLEAAEWLESAHAQLTTAS